MYLGPSSNTWGICYFHKSIFATAEDGPVTKTPQNMSPQKCWDLIRIAWGVLQISRELREEKNMSGKAHVVQRIIGSVPFLKYWKMMKGSVLTEKHNGCCPNFARRYINWGDHLWMESIFTDEPMHNLDVTDEMEFRYPYLRKAPNRFTIWQNAGGSLMDWGHIVLRWQLAGQFKCETRFAKNKSGIFQYSFLPFVTEVFSKTLIWCYQKCSAPMYNYIHSKIGLSTNIFRAIPFRYVNQTCKIFKTFKEFFSDGFTSFRGHLRIWSSLRTQFMLNESPMKCDTSSRFTEAFLNEFLRLSTRKVTVRSVRNIYLSTINWDISWNFAFITNHLSV